jgi:hypothetical protein
VFAYGDDPFFGAAPASPSLVVDIVPSSTGVGYRIVRANGSIATLGPLPTLAATTPTGPVVAVIP